MDSVPGGPTRQFFSASSCEPGRNEASHAVRIHYSHCSSLLVLVLFSLPQPFRLNSAPAFALLVDKITFGLSKLSRHLSSSALAFSTFQRPSSFATSTSVNWLGQKDFRLLESWFIRLRLTHQSPAATSAKTPRTDVFHLPCLCRPNIRLELHCSRGRDQ